MLVRAVLLSGAALLALSLSTIAQNLIVVNTAALNEHVDHRTLPIYPPIARAARVQGAVVFEVEVGTRGTISSMKVVSGPAMLQQAAIDCLKQWTFHPFEKDGVPVPATGNLSIAFTLNEESSTKGESKSAKFKSSVQRCRSAMQEGKDPALAAGLCQEAADLGVSLFPAKVSSPDDEIAKRNALVVAAQAFAQNRNLVEAQSDADKAVAIVLEGYDFDSDCVRAFLGRAAIEIQRNQFEAADRDLAFAVDRQLHFFEMQKMFPSAILTMTQKELVALLHARAENLTRLNRSDEAKKLLEEAAKYE